MEKRLTRAEVPPEFTWDIEDLFADIPAMETEIAAIEADLPRMERHKGRMGEGAAAFKACLDDQEALLVRLRLVYYYAFMRLCEDGTSEENQAAFGKASALHARVDAAMAFVKTEILALPEGRVEQYLAEEPGLVSLDHYLEKILRTRPHQLSDETEFVLASLREVLDAPNQLYDRVKSSDLRFPSFVDGEGQTRELSFSAYEEIYEKSADTATRRHAFAAFATGLKGHQHTLAANFATEVKKYVVLARLRKFPSATHMLLEPQGVSIEAYENVLDIIQSELAPHMRRYAALRRRVLGLDKLLYCDIEAPLDPSYDRTFSFAEASEWIIDGLSVLGPEYGNMMRTALTDRRVDLADNVGKYNGAFCACPYGKKSYVMMTWTGSARNVLLLAHELGHFGHYELTNGNHRFLNTDPSMFFSEAPSTINELLVARHMMSSSGDERMRRAVIMNTLATYHHNFVRHLLEGELQRRAYELAERDRAITAETLSQLKGDILGRFWGDEVEIDDGARFTWMRQGHYYVGLYPYTYAAGLALATAAAEMIRQEGRPAVERWLAALKAGGTKGPLELASMAGVDMSKPDPIHKAVAYVGSLIDELEKSFGAEPGSHPYNQEVQP